MLPLSITICTFNWTNLEQLDIFKTHSRSFKKKKKGNYNERHKYETKNKKGDYNVTFWGRNNVILLYLSRSHSIASKNCISFKIWTYKILVKFVSCYIKRVKLFKIETWQGKRKINKWFIKESNTKLVKLR